jgi:hypothetical protein
MKPLLEPPPFASQGSRNCFSRNYTRGVERLLEFQLYSPKEREVLWPTTKNFSSSWRFEQVVFRSPARIGACLGVLGRQDRTSWGDLLSFLERGGLDPFLVPFLDRFWATFWSHFGFIFGAKTTSKSGPFFRKVPAGLWKACWEAFWPSWGSLGKVGVPKVLQKTLRNDDFQNRSFSLWQVLGRAFGAHFGVFWGGFGHQKGPKSCPKSDQKLYLKIYQKNTNFGPQNGANRGTLFSYFLGSQPKMAPRRPQTSPRRPKMAPRGPQDDPRRPQDCPKTTQDGPKMA